MNIGIFSPVSQARVYTQNHHERVDLQVIRIGGMTSSGGFPVSIRLTGTTFRRNLRFISGSSLNFMPKITIFIRTDRLGDFWGSWHDPAYSPRDESHTKRISRY